MLRVITFLGLREPHARLHLWGAVAVLSVAAGIVLGLQPGRSLDLTIVQGWLQHWISTGTSVYPVSDLEVDYPPFALVLLLPLHALPQGMGPLLFMVFNLATTCLMVWMLAGWMADETGVGTAPRARLAFALMLLTWGAIRVGLWNGQTVALAICAAIYTIRSHAHSPWRAGAALAVAACKPTLGIAVGLILLFRGGYRVITVGLGLALALTLGYETSVSLPPFASLPEYLASLERMYTGEFYFRGVTNLRAVFVDWSNQHPWSHVAFGIYGLITLAALLRIGWTTRDRPGAHILIATACLLWTLVALPNQRYYLVLLAPIVWLLLWTPERLATPGARWPAWTAVGLILFNMIDGPMTIRYFAEHVLQYTSLPWEWLWWSSYVIAAPVILALYVQVLRVLRRLPA
jgi:Glycosyltransferase family 87